MVTATTTPTAEQIAATFVRLLAEQLSARQWDTMRQRNATPAYATSCASHDFCDANMVMLAAFAEHGLDGLAGMDHDPALWNTAWEIARSTKLSNKKKAVR